MSNGILLGMSVSLMLLGFTIVKFTCCGVFFKGGRRIIGTGRAAYPPPRANRRGCQPFPRRFELAFGIGKIYVIVWPFILFFPVNVFFRTAFAWHLSIAFDVVRVLGKALGHNATFAKQTFHLQPLSLLKEALQAIQIFQQILFIFRKLNLCRKFFFVKRIRLCLAVRHKQVVQRNIFPSFEFSLISFLPPEPSISPFIENISFFVVMAAGSGLRRLPHLRRFAWFGRARRIAPRGARGVVASSPAAASMEGPVYCFRNDVSSQPLIASRSCQPLMPSLQQREARGGR